MKFKYTLTFLYLLGIISITFAQNSDGILCKILDSNTKYPVSFATVQFEGEQNGVVADEEGEFRLPVEYKTSNRTIIISSIGFQTISVAVSTLNTNNINNIYLTPKVEALSAVLVIAESKSNSNISSPEEIIKEAIRRIPLNYPTTPHAYMAYYRDYQLVNNKYYNLNEYILETFDAGFQTSKFAYSKNQTAKYFYERNKDYYLDSLLLESVYGKAKIINKDESAKFITALSNELEMLNGHNPIRNYDKLSFSFVDKFKDDFVHNHIFRLEGIKYINDTPLYEISFVSHDADKAKFKAKGNIFISKTNFAIYKVEYKMIENERFAQSRYNRGKSTKFELRERLNTIYEINVEYKPINDKMYLNYMTFNNRFIIREPHPFKITQFEFDPKDKAFYITFNKAVDSTSIERKSRFRLLYKDKKLIVKQIELVKPNITKIEVVDWSAGIDAQLSDVKPEDFSYVVKSIKDVSGAKLNKEAKLLGFQFREFFTQEVFENKEPIPDLIYVIKTMPLSATYINTPHFDINKYWVNSPLKKTKGINEF